MLFMEKVTAHLNQHLAMCSIGQVNYFKATYGLDAVCIPGAVNLPDKNAGSTSDILERYSLEGKKYFLFMGRLVQDKNPDYLIRAFKKSNHDGYKLVIAGANDADTEYVRHLHEIGSDCPDIVFTGAVYGEDKAWLLTDAYCFCLPSTIEGLSIVMMEAASYKLPTIASNIDANKEFLENDAIYVRPENESDLVNAIEYAIAHPEELDKLKDVNFQKIVNTYTWDKVAVKYIDYLRTLGIK